MSNPLNFSELNLDPLLQKALVACNYTSPTPIQEKAIPAILAGEDVAASAETGSGKTAAFVLPALNHLQQKGQDKKSRILILTPTRELATQIATEAGKFGKFMRFRIVCLVGGLPYHQQIRDLSRGADIIVATPGRLLDHVRSKRVDLSGIEMLVLDEADRMLDMGFIEDIETVIESTPASRQTLLFSATLDKSMHHIMNRLMKNPTRIDLSKDISTSANIKQLIYKARNMHHKTAMLREFLNDENIYKAIIFSSTKANAERLAQELCDDGFSAASLHGDLRQRVRDRTIDQLRTGRIQFLVATDVAARGIDINDITHVFNYDLPRDTESYVHRIGRTGRAGKHGTAISFVTSSDFSLLQRIERYIGKRLSFETAGPTSSPAFKEVSDQEFRRDRNDAPRGRPTFNARSSSNPRSASSTRSSSNPRSASGEKRYQRDDRDGDRFVKRQTSDRPAPFRNKERFDDRDQAQDKPRRASFKDRPQTDDRSDRFVTRREDRPHTDRKTEWSSERSDRPRRAFGDKPSEYRSGGYKGPRKASTDDRSSPYADRRHRDDRSERSSERSDRPARKPFGDSPARSAHSKPAGRFAEKKPGRFSESKSGRFSESKPGRFSEKKSASDSRPSRFSDDRPSRSSDDRSGQSAERKPKRGFSEQRFQRLDAPKTTTWRKKEKSA